MLDTLQVLPPPFWIVIALLAGGCYWSVLNLRRGIGIPAIMVLATIAAWYVGDALYNDYRTTHMQLFTAAMLLKAWWQVVVFLAVFLMLTPLIHNALNRRYLGRASQVLNLFNQGVNNARFQRGLTILFRAGLAVWLLLLVFAVFNFKQKFFYYLFPYLGKHPGSWAVSGVASGGMDTLLALANYLQLMVGALFGVVAALSTNPGIRGLATLGICLIWPYYIFDRTRKFILLVVLPGLLAFVFIRLRGGMVPKLVAFAALFLLMNAWFGFIIANRAEYGITDAVKQEGFDFSKASEEKHQGLNMFEELAWITTFTSSGNFAPKWGQNYYANLANPIPRALWPGKPTIGIDYALARGQGGSDEGAGVYSTLSNGVIGQGLVNFGLYFGPAFAALLASLWACWLARLDLDGQRIGYLPLYGLGLILTFNMGRDITFLELYPFVFGYAICWWLNRQNPHHLQGAAAGQPPRRKSKRNQGLGVSPNPPPITAPAQATDDSGRPPGSR